jgi:hypothetical protein
VSRRDRLPTDLDQWGAMLLADQSYVHGRKVRGALLQRVFSAHVSSHQVIRPMNQLGGAETHFLSLQKVKKTTFLTADDR